MGSVSEKEIHLGVSIRIVHFFFLTKQVCKRPVTRVMLLLPVMQVGHAWLACVWRALEVESDENRVTPAAQRSAAARQ